MHTNSLYIHYLGVNLEKITCLILAVVPFVSIVFHALLQSLHYSRGYLGPWLCLNAIVVPFVSVGSRALSFYITSEVLGTIKMYPIHSCPFSITVGVC